MTVLAEHLQREWFPAGCAWLAEHVGLLATLHWIVGAVLILLSIPVLVRAKRNARGELPWHGTIVDLLTLKLLPPILGRLLFLIHILLGTGALAVGVLLRLPATPGKLRELGAWVAGWGETGRLLLFVGLSLAACLLVVKVISILAMFFIWLERKASGHIQARLGPMYVGGWHGWAQSIADGVKLLLKEDLVPKGAEPLFFRLAPFIVFMGAFAVFAAMPFGMAEGVLIAAADLDIALLYILAVSSTGVIGVILAGWASNNKWSLFGALRSAAQVVSYEIPVALAVLSVVVAVGSLNLGAIAEAQSGWGGFHWHVFVNPFLAIAFLLFYVGVLAETNRAPFDIPEAESELVAGFHTEYSGIRFSFFFLAEYANMFAVSMVASICFLGGWYPNFGIPALGVLVLLAKAMFLVFVMIWLRWTLPRLRVDQLMNISWKVLMPWSFACFLGSAVWTVWAAGKGAL